MLVASLFDEIRSLKLDLARRDPRAGMPIVPPLGASPALIAAVERKLGRSLPSSCREFYALHDGFPQLYQGASLLSSKQIVRGAYVDLARLVADPEGEAHGRRSKLVPFGIDANAETIFAFDFDASRSGGEIEVVVWMNEIGTRLADFASFLELVIDMLRSDLDERVRAPGSRSNAVPRGGLLIDGGRAIRRGLGVHAA